MNHEIACLSVRNTKLSEKNRKTGNTMNKT